MKIFSKIKENKICKILLTIIKVCIVIVACGFVIVVFMQRFSNNKLSFFNFRMFTVVSGSMAPKYNIGDVLIAKHVEASKIKVGDAISYLGNYGSFKDKVITHEVVGIEKDENGKYKFRTKGLANIIEDPIVLESQLYGVIWHKTFLLSKLYKVIATTTGFYFLIILPFMYVIGREIITTMLDKEDKRRQALKDN